MRGLTVGLLKQNFMLEDLCDKVVGEEREESRQRLGRGGEKGYGVHKSVKILISERRGAAKLMRRIFFGMIR